MCVHGAQGLAVGNMHALHISTDFWVLSRFWKERDYHAVPFGCWFISQLLSVACKCERSLSHESIRKGRYFECFFFFLIPGMECFCDRYREKILCNKKHFLLCAIKLKLPKFSSLIQIDSMAKQLKLIRNQNFFTKINQ